MSDNNQDHRFTSAIKWHGGKHYLAARIVSLVPREHTQYVEPFFGGGGGAVLLAKDPANQSEVANDLNGWLRDWGRHSFDLPNNVSGGPAKSRMTEVVWCNF